MGYTKHCPMNLISIRIGQI